MKNVYLILFLLLAAHFNINAQNDSLGYPQIDQTIKSNPLNVKPLFGLGMGSMAYFGDLYRYKGTSPMMGNWGVTLGLGARLTNYLDVQFNYTYGWLSYNENTDERSDNFRSIIRTSALVFTYNFNNFFKEQPTVNPIVILGVENVEFNSKTDLDGDYFYETDLRALDLDDLGDYQQSSLSIPVGIGADIELVSGFSVRISSVMHFTLTDNIDNISDIGVGIRKGDSRNDRYLYTGVTLLYTLDKNKRLEDAYAGAYFGDTGDEDLDLVLDIFDNCPHTPEGVEIDEFGCPLDRDMDGIPDYLDEELDSPLGSIVNDIGVELTDEDFLEMYLTYIDSIGLYTNTIATVFTSNETGRNIVHAKRTNDEIYSVQISASSDDISIEQIGKILSIPNVRLMNDEEPIYYLVGEYEELELAIEEKILLEKEGIKGKVIGIEKGKRVYVGQIADEIEEDYLSGKLDVTERSSNSDQVIYRVQIGAFTHPLSMNIFGGVGDMLVLKGEDGLTRYLTGSYDNIQQAASRKIDVLLEGFEGSFIVAYRGGKRISLEEAGNVTSNVAPVAQDKVDKSKIRFKVQVGAYKERIPANVMDQFISIGNVRTVRQSGITRYLVGEYEAYEDAKSELDSLKSQGFNDAFVVGTFNSQIISVEEAKKMLEQ